MCGFVCGGGPNLNKNLTQTQWLTAHHCSYNGLVFCAQLPCQEAYGSLEV